MYVLGLDPLQELGHSLLGWWNLREREIDLDAAKGPDYWLEFGIVDAVVGLDDSQFLIQGCVLRNLTLRRRVMLLIAQKNMVQQRAITRQERASYVQRHGVPQLALLRLLLGGEVLELADLVLELDDESNLGRCAEVAHDEEADHFEEAVSGEALLISPQKRQIFELQRANLHDIANI